MSESSAPHLRPVPAEGEVAATDHSPAGLTPPMRREGGSRFVSDVVVELGMVPRERVEVAVEEARRSGRTPEQVLLEGGALTQDQLSRAIAQRFGLYHADLSLFKPDLSAVNLIPAQAARRFNAVPIGRND